MAEFLRVLHSFPVQEAIQRGVPPTDTIKRLDLAYRMPQVQENFSKVVALKLIPDVQDLERYISEVEIEEVPQPKSLVHGDLHIRNFLIDQEGAVTGIVDHRVKELVRFRAIHVTLLLMLYGHDQGQAQLVEATKDSLRLALANE